MRGNGRNGGGGATAAPGDRPPHEREKTNGPLEGSEQNDSQSANAQGGTGLTKISVHGKKEVEGGDWGRARRVRCTRRASRAWLPSPARYYT